MKNKQKIQVTIEVDVMVKSEKDALLLANRIIDFLDGLGFEPEWVSVYTPVSLPDLPPVINISGMDIVLEAPDN